MTTSVGELKAGEDVAEGASEDGVAVTPEFDSSSPVGPPDTSAAGIGKACGGTGLLCDGTVAAMCLGVGDAAACVPGASTTALGTGAGSLVWVADWSPPPDSSAPGTGVGSFVPSPQLSTASKTTANSRYVAATSTTLLIVSTPQITAPGLSSHQSLCPSTHRDVRDP